MKKFFFTTSVLCLFLFVGQLNCSALDNKGVFDAISLEKQQTIRQNLNLIRVHSNPSKHTFTTFDVNDSGLIAIGSWGTDPCIIYVFQLDGSFEYGYQFDTPGAFKLKWNGENLIIHLLRGNAVVELNHLGEIQNIAKAKETTEGRTYWKSHTEKYIENQMIVVKNDFGPLNFLTSSYSKVVRIDGYGEVHVIYDATSVQLIEIIFKLICVLLFLGGIIYILSFSIRR